MRTFQLRELDDARLRSWLSQLPDRSIAVVGDYFLDKYLVIDRGLREVSLETGLEAHQVVATRCAPGAAGTVTSNLRALGIGTVHAVGVIGDDGEGYELRKGLLARGVSIEYLLVRDDCHTPTYTKPMIRESDGSEHEIERLDVKNRQSLSTEVEDEILERLAQCVRRVDAVLIADQVPERNCGVITDRVRAALEELASAYPGKLFLVDSRVRVGEFGGVALKPNCSEAARALEPNWRGAADRGVAERCGLDLARRARRTVFVTLGADGIVVCGAGAGGSGSGCVHVPGVRVTGPIDPVGAGDSAAAGIAVATCAGASPAEAAAVGNLVASITVQQIGTTGTATPRQVMERLAESRVTGDG